MLPEPSALLDMMAASFIRSMGCITPLGSGIESLIKGIASGQVCPRSSPPIPLSRDLPAAGWIKKIQRPDPWIARSERRLRFGRLDRLTQLSMVAAQEAVQNAGKLLPKEQSGIVWGTALGSHLANEMFFQQLQEQGASEVSPALFVYTLPSSSAGEIAICFGLQNAALTVATGLSAGLEAVAMAAERVEKGRARWMLAGAGDTLSATSIQAASTSGKPLSEAAVFFVLVSTPEGALARVAGSTTYFGEGARQRAEEEVLERVGLYPKQLQMRIHYQPDRFDLERSLGFPMAAGPLLGICAAKPPANLPLIATTFDPAEQTASALCLIAVEP